MDVYIKINLMLEKQYKTEWIQPVQDRIKCQVYVKSVIKFQVLQKLRISWPAKQLPTSQGELCTNKLLTYALKFMTNLLFLTAVWEIIFLHTTINYQFSIYFWIIFH
jgi:hypothetical protein